MHNNIVIVIPAYEPESSLTDLVRSIRAEFSQIIVVDDGPSRADDIFADVSSIEGVTLLKHEHNKGKGAALKTAFAEVLKRFPSADGVVTVDADGQHLLPDIISVAESTDKNRDRFTLGVRGFDGDVPLRSRFGNAWSRWTFFLLTGTMVYDTQTGLRGMPMKFLQPLCDMPGNRYEYESRMLVAMARMKQKPVQIKIKTVYLEGNRTSHFNPIRDSLRIQATLLAARLSRKTVLPS